jgi:predicted nucleic acid-binding protein
MAIILFDTSILIDHYNGYAAATRELGQYSDAAISAITWIEVACRMTEGQRALFIELLVALGIRIMHMDDDIMMLATILRRETIVRRPKVALPDCIIVATASASQRIVVTRNPRDFGGPHVRVPYDIVDGVATNIRPAPI